MQEREDGKCEESKAERENRYGEAVRLLMTLNKG
jgi:hypothetical protein